MEYDDTNSYTLLVDSTEEAEPFPSGADVRLVNSTAPATVAASANGRRSLRDLWNMSRALSSSSFDVLLFPTIYSYVPVFSRAKKLVIVHDIIAETYPELTVPRLPARLFWKTKVTAGRMQADALVTVSEYSRRGFIKKFGIAESRIHVVGEASDPVFRVLENPQMPASLSSLGIDPAKPTVLYVGGFSPHKNLEELVNACGVIATRDQFRHLQLVMVGDHSGDVFHTYFDTIRQVVDRAGIADRTIFPGFVPDDELVPLLNLATVLVLPSLMEGFGLPAVEAAACGCPVIATRESPLPELLGSGGVYVTPGSGDLPGVLESVLSSDSLRKRLSRCGVEAAGRLTWEAAARQMLEVIHKVACQ